MSTNWRDEIEAEMADYEKAYQNIRADLRRKWLSEKREWLESLARVRRIWEILIEVWDTRNTDWGWAVYWNLKKRDGSVPNPDELTAEHVRDGLLLEYFDKTWTTWIEREYIAYKAKQEV